MLCPSEYDEIGWQSLLKSRQEVEAFIQEFPDFKMTHSPFPIRKNDPVLIQEMCKASELMQIGPMSTIAGVMAEAALQAMLDAGAQEAVVDNGGDVVFLIQEKIHVGIFAGTSKVKNLAFLLDPQERPLAICTSSGTVGHSYSYGKADAAIVISHDIALADAAATALGNQIKSVEDLENCFRIFETLSSIQGALVIYKDRIAMWGHLPEIVKADVDHGLITRERIFS